MNLSDRERKNLEKIYPFLGECTLFLKRDNAFPLASPCKIAAYGRGVRHTIKGGSGSGDVNARFFTTIEEGLEAAGFTITSKEWLDKVDELYPLERKNWIKQVRRDAKKMKMLAPVYAIGKVMPEPEYQMPLSFDAEAAIYVVSRISGEGADREFVRGDILLTNSEVRDIKELNKRYKKFMLIINAGGVVDLSRVEEVRNILILSELGTETGRALADILLGKLNPSGKLSATWANLEDYPYDREIPIDDTYYLEGKYVGYRYFDTFKKEPLYPFGYGLSYTSFKLDNYSFSKQGKNVKVDLEVTNTGKYKGKEVVQAYISYLGKEEWPYQELAGFIKTNEIEPGKKEKTSLFINLRNIAKYSVEKELYYLPKGEYLIRIGNSSRNTVPVAIINLDQEIVTQEAHNMFSNIGIDVIKAEFEKEKPAKLPKITINQMDFGVIANEEKPLVIPEEIKKLKTKDLVKMNCGLVGNQHSLAFVGESSVAAPGAAGEISSEFVKLFKRNVVMADGPAGVRLTRCYYKKGNKIKKVDLNAFLVDALEFVGQPLKGILKKMLIKKVDTDKIKEIYYQYCTALPIATAIAQSFNRDLAFTCGDIVGSEMDEYKIDLWLAPAMNIQRTIMCGRNFEYYSEDPLLSGLMATYVTKGVESHPGKGVVVKHYAANNQETFRYVSNSVVDEATLREIYLRPFEICIREANPKGVMSSYNLVNGIHVSESKEMIRGFLYGENAYDGVILTDWIIRGSRPRLAKYDISRIQNVYKTSTSLFMPGSKYDIKQLCKELRRHPQNRYILEENATRLYKNFAK